MEDDQCSKDAGDGIAVIGMSCRFPGTATSPQGLWEMMKNKNTAWSEIPPDRVNIDGFYHPDGQRQGSISFRGAHFLLQDLARFDAAFFSVTEEEAKAMDPQQRLLLETSYEAIENAGLRIEDLGGSNTSVFVGSFVKDYEQVSLRDAHYQPRYAATGTGNAILANRISYFYDLQGPSMTIDTGCSGSLVAIHQACETLRHGESSIAFAAGAGVILTPNTMMPMTALNFLSPDGRSFSFDARANGYGRGEGVGFVILKRLTDALRDQDPIRAIIRGTGICQDGRTPGIVFPSTKAQVSNITSVYHKAGLCFDQTAYVECHGTGTRAGDFVELSAVAATLAAARSQDSPVIVGSVKPNIGHLEGAAGVAGLIKSVLVLEKGEIPPQANFMTGNPRVDFRECRLKVPTDLCQWPLPGLRRVSINCFGFGGTNAHAILDEAEFHVKRHRPTNIGRLATLAEAEKIVVEDDSSTPLPQLFTFTSPDQQGVVRIMHQYADHIWDTLDFKTTEDLNNLSYTLNCRRSQFDWKGYVVANTQEELAETLGSTDVDKVVRSKTRPHPKIAFLFGGQGAQFPGMGSELFDRFEVLRSSLEAATEYLLKHLGSQFNLMTEVLKIQHESVIHKPSISQPATTAIQMGIVDLMKACNVHPSSAVGHSSGEIAAAYACGMISREDAWTIAFYRGACAEQMSIRLSGPRFQGLMCAVSMSEDDMRSYLSREGVSDTIQVACINSPKSVTISGDASGIRLIAVELKERGVYHRILDVPVAYHSYHMKYVDSEYKACLQDLPMDFCPGIAPMFSSVTGSRMELGVQSSRYWTDNLTSPVLFSDAMKIMLQESRPDVLLEFGPQSTLRTSVTDILDDMFVGRRIKLAPRYVSAMARGNNEAYSVLSALGALWSQGCNVDMQGMVKKTCVPLKTLRDLPSYPWDHSRQYWHESPMSREYRLRSHGRQDLLGEPTADSIPMEPQWRGFLRVYESPWIRDHQVQRTMIYPAAGIVTMVIEGIRQHTSDKADKIAGFEIIDMVIEAPLIVPESRYGLETSLNAKQLFQEWHHSGDMSYSWTLYARAEGRPWARHAWGEVQCHMRAMPDAESDQTPAFSCEHRFKAAELKSTEVVSPLHMYQALEVVGMNYGPSFRNITSVSRGENVAVGQVTIPDTKFIMPHKFEFDHVLHPATLDAMFQLLLAIDTAPMVPTRIDSIYVSTQIPKDPGTRLDGFAKITSTSVKGVDAQLAMTVQNWDQPAVVIKGLHLNALPQTNFLPGHHNLCTEIRWMEFFGTAKPSQFSHLLQLVAHQYPGLSILQHGGNYDMAKHVLDMVASGDDHVPRLLRYSLTGLDQEVLVALKNAYSGSPINNLLERRALSGNVEADPRYHLIISSSRNSDRDRLLALLHPDGLLLETRPHDSFPKGNCDPQHVTMAYSQDGNYISEQLSLTRAHRKINDRYLDILIIVPNAPDRNLQYLASCLEAKLCQLELKPCISTLEEACLRDSVDAMQTTMICLLDLNHSTEGSSSFVWNWTEEKFHAFRKMRALSKAMLWVTRGADKKSTLPKNAPIIGLARTLNSEDLEKVMVTLDLDNDSWIASPSVIDNIVQTLAGLNKDDTIGNDLAGIVLTVGDSVHNIRPGDQVVAVVPRGALKSVQDIDQRFVKRVPCGLRKCIPSAWIQAYYGLVTRCAITNDQTVLILHGTSATGQAAIQITQALGAKVYTTISGNDLQVQRRELSQHFSLDANRVYNSDDSDWCSKMLRSNEQVKVDIVYNPGPRNLCDMKLVLKSTGTSIRHADSLVPDACRPYEDPPLSSIIRLDLALLLENEPALVGDIFTRVVDFVQEHYGTIQPVLFTRACAIDSLSHGFAAVRDNGSCGGTLVTADSSSMVLLPPSCQNSRLQDALDGGTYVLAGGLGGLGRSVARRLAGEGAKNIVFLSRTAPSSIEAIKCIKFLRGSGVRVLHIMVDICDAEAVKDTYASIVSSGMPPVSGIVQAAGILQDSLYDKMSFEDWMKVMRPKTLGSSNLVEHFGRPADLAKPPWFIFLSSSAGIIGNRGQANYAAANVYLDALARSGKIMGRAYALDIGPILAAGMATDSDETLKILRASGFYGIRLDDFLKVFERAVVGEILPDVLMPSQVVLGVGTGGLMLQNKSADPFWARTALYSYLKLLDMPPPDLSVVGSATANSLKSKLGACEDLAEATALVCHGLKKEVSSQATVGADQMDESKPLKDYGVDSLTAVQVRAWALDKVGASLSVFNIMSNKTMLELSEEMARTATGFGKDGE
ncbi:polyketide synthase [Verticillium nonalfalfae]|uniref:Polyketide synthase n=1 Tax=Verticillium nonalfalfae TaxID=1051616 RepID=A0A3M9XVR2_9PEZI|nr:polyketide synthase [Verticillium nonalfalfae]RNJ52367.1 polyketide synthase [Verticillium nonalfalfae]